jgi:hypothetical protein
VAVAIANSATAPGLQSDSVWEIGRLCCGSSAPKYTASRLLGALGRIMDAAGVELAISYCRIDERGSCYLAAGWRPVAICKGRQHNTGNRAARWLPGLGEDRPSTEIVDRVRWERGPKAAAASLAWDGARWAERTTA